MRSCLEVMQFRFQRLNMRNHVQRKPSDTVIITEISWHDIPRFKKWFGKITCSIWSSPNSLTTITELVKNLVHPDCCPLRFILTRPIRRPTESCGTPTRKAAWQKWTNCLSCEFCPSFCTLRRWSHVLGMCQPGTHLLTSFRPYW